MYTMKPSYMKQCLSLGISSLLISPPVMAEDIVVDPTRTGQHTSLDTAANGTPVVNIATPNTNGVSHNTYIEFNVPTQGTILNNSGQEVNTQLAGYIYGNENLRDGSASLILNEVSGTNRSRLNGYLEVAGPSADVIVANPNGITVNGGGFINIPKATLTTGKVGFNGDKPIFDVEGGDILIDGKGLDASHTSSLELYTQAIKLNAKLHANDLKVVTGLNHIDADGRVTSKDSAEKERPLFSIDSTALGGIYANAISLVGTQKGVGVNLPSEMLVQENLELSADGKIILGTVSVQNKANIHSKSSSIEVEKGVHAGTLELKALSDITLHGNTGATGDLTLQGKSLTNEGLIAAGVKSDFTQTEEGLLDLSFTENIYNVGVLYGLSSIVIDTKHFNNADQAEVITDTLTMHASESLKNSGLIYANDLINITAGRFDNTLGTIEGLENVHLTIANRFLNNNGLLYSGDALTLKTDTLDNTEGTIQANGTLRVSALGDIENRRGTLYSGTGTTVTAQKLNNEHGFIGSLKAVFLDLFSLDGDNGTISGEGVTIHTSSMQSSHATIFSSAGLDIDASGDVRLTNAALYAYDDMRIHAQALYLNNVLLFAQDRGAIDTSTFHNSNSMISAAQMQINTDTLHNADSYLYSDRGTLNITATDTLDNSHGLISANGDLVVNTPNLDNRNGELEAGNTLDISSDNLQIENSRFFAGEHLDVTSNISTIDVDTKFLSANAMDLDFSGDLVHHGEILANGEGNIMVHGDLDNEGSITANGSLYIAADTLTNNADHTGASIRGGYLSNIMLNGDLNNHGFLTSSGDLEITASTINNYAGIAASYALTLNAVNLYNDHTLLSGTDMHLYIADLLSNHEDAEIYAGMNLFIASDADGGKTTVVENISGRIESGTDMYISAGEISNISATEITTTLQKVNGRIDITCDIWESFACPALAIPLETDLMAIKAEIIQEYSDKGVTLSDSELQALLTERMIQEDREAYILNMYKDTKTTANELYFYELTASLNSNAMIVKRTKPHKKEEFRKVDYTVTQEVFDPTLLSDHKEGEIIAGHDLSLNADTITNRTSLIAAGNDMAISGDLFNIGVETTESIDATINYSWKRKGDGGLGQLPISKSEIRDTEGIPSRILAGGTLSGDFGMLQNGMEAGVSVSIDPNAPTISTSTQSTNDTQQGVTNANANPLNPDQGSVESTVLALQPQLYDPSQEGITLPNNPYGVFVLSQDPVGPLIESNPEYTNYRNFVSSDYMLERLGYDGTSQLRRLGDAMYETQLIRDAIMAMTGERFIGMAQDDNEQYIKLMNAGIAYARDVGLELGVPPTPLQLKNLKEDLVWMEEKVIQGNHVLVPVLYLAKAYNKPTGATIAAKRMNVTVDGYLGNSGNIQTKEGMQLRTGTLINYRGKIEAGSKMHLSAVGDMKNLSGSLKGGSVVLESTQGNIVNESLSKRLEREHSVGEETHTLLDRRASIEATNGYLVVNAAKNIENTGADIKSKDGISLQAGEDVTIKTLKEERSYDYTFYNGFAKGESTTHHQSNVQTDGLLDIQAGENANLEAVNIQAGNARIGAGHNVNFIAVTDSSYSSSYFERDELLSSSSVADASLQQSVKGTTIETGIVQIKGEEGIVLESARLTAAQAVSISSGKGNVDFTAKSYSNTSYHEESDAMFGGLISSRSVDEVSETLLSDSSASAESQIVVAGKNVNLVATDMKTAKGGIKLSATENVNIVSGMESQGETHIREESGVSLGLSDGRLTVAEETKESISSTTHTNKASNISANALLIESGKDTNVIASNITAGGMQVDAGRDFNLLSDKDTISTHEAHSKKEIGIEVTLTSEEASLFAGYWEEEHGAQSTQSDVASSSIVAGNLQLNAQNANVVGSNIAGKDISLNAENIRILSDTTSTQTDAYTSAIKAGIEVGVKQNLSSAVNAIAEVGESESGSAVAAKGLQAYDAVQLYAEQPVTAGVNAIYEEANTNTYSTNGQVVASSITATNSVTLHAENGIEIAGSDVGSANELTFKAKTINIHASEGMYRSESSSDSQNAKVGLYGTRMGQATAGYQENEMTTEGTYQRNSQLYAGGQATFTSAEDTTLGGANIEARNLELNIGGDLHLQSFQDRQTIEGSSKGGSVSGSVITGIPTGASANAGQTSGEKAWVSQTTGINGSQTVRVNVGGTTTLTGASITNIDENGIEQGNLEVNTQHLVLNEIKDIDTYEANSAGAGVGSNDGAPSLNSVEYTNNTKDKEQLTRATIGSGTINTQTTIGTLNRDTSKVQEITRDEESNTEIYLSNRSLELLDDPEKAIKDLGKKLGDVGQAAHVEILENLPSASKGKDGEGDFIDNTIGVVLDNISEEVPLGILPSVENDGGYITQIATQLFGDNRTGIVVKDKSKLEALTTVDGEKLRERKPGDTTKDWDYEQIVMVKTEDGIKPIDEVENPEGLEQIIKYRTNPDKQLVIEDGTDRSGNPALEEYKIRISQEDIQESGIDHLFTNGMFNDHETAIYNQQTQQNGADAILNYNQQHGVIGDLLESAQDALAVNSGVSSIGTGGARQTGELIVQMAGTEIRNGDLTLGAHSQGTLMTQVGMTQHQEDLETLVQGNNNAEFLVQYSGSPVNHYIAEELMTDIYGGEELLSDRTDGKGMDKVFRSQVAPEDFVGSVLGYQSAGINNSENLGENMKESTLSVGRLFGVGGSSTHSYYGCIIGCGEENFTPDIQNYANPDKSVEPKELPVEHYYETNFIVKDENGHDKVDVNLDLLPTAQRKSDIESKQTLLDTTGGQ